MLRSSPALTARVTSLSPASRYAIAVGAAVAAAAARASLDAVWEFRVPYILFFPAVMVSAWFGGFWPGVLTTALGAIAADWWWLPPRGTLAVESIADFIGLITFTTIGIMMSGLNAAWRRGATAALESERMLSRARADAEATARQLDIAIAAGRMGTWRWTPRTGAVAWSEALEAIHGYAPGSFPATFEAFRGEIHADDRDRVLGEIQRVVDEGRDHHVEYRIVRRDGTVRWVEGRGRPVFGTDGGVEFVVGVCADTTERRQAEEQLRLAVEAAPIAMVMVDAAGQILLVNALTERLLGYNPGELIGRRVEDLVPARLSGQHAAHRATFHAAPSRRLMGVGRDLFALRKDGTEVPVEIGLSPVTIDGAVAAIATIADITDRKRVEAEREQVAEAHETARREAEQANRMKDRFIAMVSHELRTPLQAILAYTRALSAGNLPLEQRQAAVGAIERSAQAQAQLVDSLLDLARVAAGKLALQTGPVDLNAVLLAAADVVRPAADARGVSLTVTTAHRPVLTLGDTLRLQQVCWNLLSNAVRYTPAGGRVMASLTHGDSMAELLVRDTGEGISAEFLPDVFGLFTQAESARVRRGGGLGLGLAITRELVTLHGGTVAAESPGEGQGSTFRVRLPIVEP